MDIQSVRKQRGLHLNSLRAQVSILLAAFVLAVLVLNAAQYAQNRRQHAVSENISEVRMPLSLRAQQVLIGLNHASATQRGFIITGNATLTEERDRTWREEILPALAVITAQKEKLKIAENITRIERLESLLPRYRDIQERIDSVKRDNLQTTQSIDVANADSAQLAAFILTDQARKQTGNRLMATLQEEVDPIKAEIYQVINPLIETQETVLKRDVALIKDELTRSSLMIALLSLLGIGFSAVLTYRFSRQLSRAIGQAVDLLDDLAKGKLSDQLPTSKDELGAVLDAGGQLNAQLASASHFARAIGEGNFGADFRPASQHDTLGNALVHMRDQLQTAAQADERRHWNSQGTAKLSEITREYGQSEELPDRVLSFLIKYLKANQGGLFLLNDDQTALKLSTCYAYDRKRFVDKSVAIGEGLIGQAYLEQAPIFVTEVPDAYVRITSGLGEATPGCLLIVPLVHNEAVRGVLEIASFVPLAEHEVAFVEQAASSLAAVLDSLQVNVQTRELLEQAQQQAEEMRAQEEEMRQNNEELMATQEEMQRRYREFEGEMQRAQEEIERLRGQADQAGAQVTA